MIAEGNIFMLSLLMAQPSLIVQQPPAAVEVEISPMAPAPKPSPTVAEMLQLQEKGIISVQTLRQWLGDIAGVAPTSL